jgi:hypothetical protein
MWKWLKGLFGKKKKPQAITPRRVTTSGVIFEYPRLYLLEQSKAKRQQRNLKREYEIWKHNCAHVDAVRKLLVS